MIEIENHCVDCGLPCIHSACPHSHVEVHYCDKCQENFADYIIWNTELCEDCLNDLMLDMFVMIPTNRKIEMLDLDVMEVGRD